MQKQKIKKKYLELYCTGNLSFLPPMHLFIQSLYKYGHMDIYFIVFVISKLFYVCCSLKLSYIYPLGNLSVDSCVSFIYLLSVCVCVCVCVCV